MNQKEAGNVLFIILIAVVLFGALIYTVSQGNRTAENTMNREHANILINEITAYGAQVQKAISRLMTIKGCTDEQINFEHANYFGGYSNSNAPTDDSCDVFSSSGGNVPFMAPPVDARVKDKLANTAHWNRDFVYVFLNDNAVLDVGGENTEILMMVTFVKDSVCEQVNRRFDITGGNVRSGVDFSGYSAIYSIAETFGDSATDAGLAGHPIGCITETGSGTAGNHIYFTLVQR